MRKVGHIFENQDIYIILSNVTIQKVGWFYMMTMMTAMVMIMVMVMMASKTVSPQHFSHCLSPLLILIQTGFATSWPSISRICHLRHRGRKWLQVSKQQRMARPISTKSEPTHFGVERVEPTHFKCHEQFWCWTNSFGWVLHKSWRVITPGSPGSRTN